jgi:FtsH-binding integral membrane protein
MGRHSTLDFCQKQTRTFRKPTLKAKSLQLIYTHVIDLYTVLIHLFIPCAPHFPTRSKQMDWLYLLLIIALFGLSVLLIRGIEKLRRPV